MRSDRLLFKYYHRPSATFKTLFDTSVSMFFLVTTYAYSGGSDGVTLMLSYEVQVSLKTINDITSLLISFQINERNDKTVKGTTEVNDEF